MQLVPRQHGGLELLGSAVQGDRAVLLGSPENMVQPALTRVARAKDVCNRLSVMIATRDNQLSIQ
eukprot:11790355-Karenia_brevis.AAC.1